jgi:3-deoxy-7-phosphoheptulonate synthase
MLGPCAEHVSLEESIQDIIDGYQKLHETAYNMYEGNVLPIIRGAGQASKPRSLEMENGQYSYYGDMVNSLTGDRTPDPSRMVAAAIQSRDISKALEHNNSQHVMLAHEALLLPYERNFILDENGDQFLASADMPWIGERTRKKGSLQVQLLDDVYNPIGIKIGPETTQGDIAYLAEKLNPLAEPGKLAFIFRFGRDRINNASVVLDAINRLAPNSIIMSDPCHGNTVKVQNRDGQSQKTRIVEDMIDEVVGISDICNMYGMKLHGLHLEAVAMSEDKKQCIDKRGELPTCKSDVDPQLNIVQLRKLLKATKDFLL